MSNYYDYREVKVMIAHKLMSMEGWKVFDYKPDESDSMTDYYSPANWGGVAEKNGYILCVNVYGASEPEEIRKYNYDNIPYDNSIIKKISRLEAMTVDRGASESEAESARITIERLRKKAEESAENRNKYIVTGIIPGHMAHPPKCNWHIEKDGIIISKGNGILKYRKVYDYYCYPHYMEDLEEYKQDKKMYMDNYTRKIMQRGYYSDEEAARKNTENHINNLEKDIDMINKFEGFISRADTTCGGLLGEGDSTVYEKVTVTKYKKELKPVELESGEIKDGQCFILKVNFNYGRSKGFVYRIHETEMDGQKCYHAYKLNGKYTKECTGRAGRANYWYVGSGEDDAFIKWIEKGAIGWCELQEVKTPYEVEKVVKKKIRAVKNSGKQSEPEKREKPQTDSERINVNTCTYEISEDTDTRTGKKIYLVKVAEKLSREEYIQVNRYMKSLGAYYSRFKHAFLFRDDPAGKLGQDVSEKPATETVKFSVTEDIHTKTGNRIWIVKPEKELNKTDFAEVKRKLAALQGFYSSFKSGFIFKYDPEEVLATG